MESPRQPGTPGAEARAGAEHLLIFPERETAESVADQLAEEGFDRVSVIRETLRTEDDDEAHEWAVHIVDRRLPEAEGGGAYEALRDRFAGLATAHEGWYDEPGDPRPPVVAQSAAPHSVSEKDRSGS
ncbi:ribonuclease E inhibitor RraB [Ornithinimicrobium cavernae]|uniref:ribonuclease E inhibitor RraB n=1 Tax=Ornithinimicrobium cavernae TaxID=2666047 RepID=UPI000D698722|nr:ribonuclease E inhibitor RraB [Ornithinimicrobium cavernae]